MLNPGTSDAGVNGTPDEVAFAAQQATYFMKYQMRRCASRPLARSRTSCSLGRCRSRQDGEGSTVFWTTGACLFKYGKNKEKAAEYIKALTYDPRIWKDSIAGTPTAHPGQLPPYKSIYAEMGREQARLDAGLGAAGAQPAARPGRSRTTSSA